MKKLLFLMLMILLFVQFSQSRQISYLQGANAEKALLEAEVGNLTMAIESLMLQNDHLMRKFRVDVFKVTGYSNDSGSINVKKWRDGMTATGKKAERGICASDWKYLPPGSLAWVKGYGWCNVQDRGGAVKGNHIDLFFDTEYEARQWGVQNKEVIVAKK